jgi:hypothetical protein
MTNRMIHIHRDATMDYINNVTGYIDFIEA